MNRALEEFDGPANAFIAAACADPRSWHGGGTLEQAEMIVARYPHVATASVYCAAVLGDESAICDWLACDRSLVTAKGGPHGWDALTYLCFSRYLRIDKARSDAFAACARTLLESGGDANTGWMNDFDDPSKPFLEAAIYGAAGVARNAALTQILLEFGADPNGDETAYHVGETYDNQVLEILLSSGRFNEQSLATVAMRKCDWHDDKGLKLALEHGANPNYLSNWKLTPLHQSIRRDNGLVMIQQLLDHQADPLMINSIDGRNAFQLAAYHGRGDILEEFERRGIHYDFSGNSLIDIDALVAACALGHQEDAQTMLNRNPSLREPFLAMGGTLIARFAGPGNDAGVSTLVALGISPNTPWEEGDGYWDLAAGSTALHVAAWRANHSLVKTLIEAGADVNGRDARNRTALQLAVNACIDSYWKYRRKPDSVAALLAAGATKDGIDLPTGYDAIDMMLTD